MSSAIITNINWFILWYFIILSAVYLLLLIGSIRDVGFRFKEYSIGNISTLFKSDIMPSVTAIIPAYNEENSILETLHSILSNNYKNTSVIVVNDGSTDKTLEVLIKEFDLYQDIPVIKKDIHSASDVKEYYLSRKNKKLTVINKVHTDKSDSLNVGLNACTTPLFITLDADTILVEPEAVNNMIFALLSKGHTVAMGGAVYILNGCEFKDGKVIEKKMSYNPISAIQICEYLRSFLFSRSGWNAFGGTLCYSGAFTLFDKQAVLDVGGFDVGNFAQDFEIITHLQEYKYQKNYPLNVGFTPSAIAWTDVPSTLRSFWHQRSHWQKGSLRSLFRHINMLFNPRYGFVGLVTYPFFLFGEILGSLVEFVAYVMIFVSWYAGVFDLYTTVLFLIICWGFTAFLTMATTLMSVVTYNKYQRIRDVLWIFLMVFVEQFGFRQYNVICKVVATIEFLLGRSRY